MTTTDYGTKADTAFFREITDVFAKHPEAAQKYALASLALEKQLGIDYGRQHAVSRIEDGRIVTEFYDRETGPQVTPPASAMSTAPARMRSQARASETREEDWPES
ncbi:hypothetical protein ACWDLL_07655, partial [Streptomyces griseoincarnatus]